MKNIAKVLTLLLLLVFAFVLLEAIIHNEFRNAGVADPFGFILFCYFIAIAAAIWFLSSKKFIVSSLFSILSIIAFVKLLIVFIPTLNG